MFSYLCFYVPVLCFYVLCFYSVGEYRLKGKSRVKKLTDLEVFSFIRRREAQRSETGEVNVDEGVFIPFVDQMVGCSAKREQLVRKSCLQF